uniref:SFRICE_031243 n=1 Tax=Spodoptera frugiperda TaxID=7108 RepID=A0A2H1WIK9_SPOFR
MKGCRYGHAVKPSYKVKHHGIHVMLADYKTFHTISILPRMSQAPPMRLYSDEPEPFNAQKRPWTPLTPEKSQFGWLEVCE